MSSEKFLFSPLEMVQLLLRRWWLLGIFMLLGAGTGCLIFILKTPVYESRALFVSSIDFSKTGDLSELEEDMAVVLLGDVIKSTPVFEDLFAAASNKIINFDPEKFKNSSFLERSNNHWVLIVRDNDPDEAALLVNLWAEAAQGQLNNALEHSLRAREVESELTALNECLGPGSEGQSEGGLCGFENISQLQEEIEKSLKSLQNEKELAMGLLPETSITLVSTAEPSKKPILYGRNTLVFFGALAGLVIGVFFIYILKR